MLRIVSRASIIGLIAGLCCSGPSIAQQQTQQSFHALVAAGYAVVATVFVPAGETSDKHSAVLVTLQKAKTVSVCTFSLGAWETMGSSTDMDDATRCDFRAY